MIGFKTTRILVRETSISVMRSDLAEIARAIRLANRGQYYAPYSVYTDMSRKYSKDAVLFTNWRERQVWNEIQTELRRLKRAMDADNALGEAYGECLVAAPKTTLAITVGIIGVCIAAACLGD